MQKVIRLKRIDGLVLFSQDRSAYRKQHAFVPLIPVHKTPLDVPAPQKLKIQEPCFQHPSNGTKVLINDS